MNSSNYETLNMVGYGALGGSGTYEKGVLTSSLFEWKLFYEEVRRFRDYKDYVWRGQRRCGDEWPLKSAFDRKHEGGKREALLNKHLEHFKKAIRGRRGISPAKLNEDELWALGQHNGLATPLLDWTESPFVAAYFAFCEREEDR